MRFKLKLKREIHLQKQSKPAKKVCRLQVGEYQKCLDVFLQTSGEYSIDGPNADIWSMPKDYQQIRAKLLSSLTIEFAVALNLIEQESNPS